MSEHDEDHKKESNPVGETEASGKKKMSKKKKAGIAGIVILAVLLLTAGLVYFVGHRYYAKTNYVSDEEAARQIEEKKKQREAAMEQEEKKEEEAEPIDPELLEAQRNMEKYASTEPITTDGNVYNVLLVGLDTTKDNWVGNSDSMILVSVNYRLHKISMISLMRDLHVNIPGVGYRKLNAAYPNGGGPLLTQTVEENFKIDVDRYVTVDFGSMIDIIDEIGTIEITFTQKEAENANKSIKQQCWILGKKSKKYLIPGEGTYECNGMQAVAYARIRKVGNSDYQRTERQREVLMKLLEKVKAMSLEDIDRLATRLLPMLTHNIPESEFWGLLAKAPTLLSYNIVQDRIPYDGMFHSYNGNLVPDWESTVRKLKEEIYGADMLDAEGNILTPTPTVTPEAKEKGTSKENGQSSSEGEVLTVTPEAPENTDQGEQTVIEPETGTGDPSAQLSAGKGRDQMAQETLVQEKKAPVIADNVPGVKGEEQKKSESSEKKPITNPYRKPVFVLQIPNAPEEANRTLVEGNYQWMKKKVNQGF